MGQVIATILTKEKISVHTSSPLEITKVIKILTLHMMPFKTSFFICLIFIVASFNNECFGQKNWADQTFGLSPKQIKRHWKFLTLDGNNLV
jgi:hypothetical protein